MRRTKIISLLFVFTMMILITACGGVTEENEAEKENNREQENEPENEATNEDEPEDLTLTELLPEKEGYVWKYDGAVEYGHEMELISIEEADGERTYTVEGEIEDVSGGESGNDYSLDLSYTVTNDTLTQRIDSDMMMDNNFSQIELIQAPLSEGNEWTQTQVNAEGEEITLESSIDSVETDGDQKIYTVTYQDADGEYYEEREIKEGVGVIHFEYLYMFEDDSMPMGYEINYDATGYKDDVKDRSEQITEEEAIDYVLDYVNEHEEYDEISAMVDGGDESTFHVRIFENHEEHIATLGWYSVDKETGEVKEEDL